jgi:hypothetical protein
MRASTILRTVAICSTVDFPGRKSLCTDMSFGSVACTSRLLTMKLKSLASVHSSAMPL